MTNREIAALQAKEVHAARLTAQMNAQTLTLGMVMELLTAVLDKCGVGAEPVEPEPKPKPAKRKSMAKMPDEEWIQECEAAEALKGVDIRQEIGKAQFWAANNNRKATRKMLVNWFFKAERTMTVQCDGQSSKKVITVDPYSEPPNWRPAAAKLYPGTDYFTGRNWGDVSLDYRKAIVSKLLSA